VQSRGIIFVTQRVLAGPLALAVNERLQALDSAIVLGSTSMSAPARKRAMDIFRSGQVWNSYCPPVDPNVPVCGPPSAPLWTPYVKARRGWG
jgi:hypothetical protein